MDNIDKSHRDIINERLDKLKAERQLLEEEREKLIGHKKGTVNIQERFFMPFRKWTTSCYC